MHVIVPTQDHNAVVGDPLVGVAPQVGVRPRGKVAAGPHGSMEPDNKITPTPLRNQPIASAMMLLIRRYRTTITCLANTFAHMCVALSCAQQTCYSLILWRFDMSTPCRRRRPRTRSCRTRPAQPAACDPHGPCSFWWYNPTSALAKLGVATYTRAFASQHAHALDKPIHVPEGYARRSAGVTHAQNNNRHGHSQ